jgi:hypothetical protein
MRLSDKENSAYFCTALSFVLPGFASSIPVFYWKKWQGFSQDQENNCEDKKDNDKPLPNRPCYPADKTKNHEYNGNNDEQYSECQEPAKNSLPPLDVCSLHLVLYFARDQYSYRIPETTQVDVK